MSGLMLFLEFLGILCAVWTWVWHALKDKKLIEELERLDKANESLLGRLDAYKKAYELEAKSKSECKAQIKGQIKSNRRKQKMVYCKVGD